jgi:hypothetical protein
MRFKRNTENGTPPIFADLVLEMPDGQCFYVDTETPGWMKDVPLSSTARVGLVHRRDKLISVWLETNGNTPRYLSRVIGKIDLDSSNHNRIRVAGLICGDMSVWLHRDGLVEVGNEPTWRE